MRMRAGTQPVTLEPSRVVEMLALARHHDDLLKEARQDLFRAETKLKIERRWKWPIRIVCVGLGAAGLAGLQTEAIRSGVASFFESLAISFSNAGSGLLVALLLLALAATVAFLLRRASRGPSPEKAARELMEQFARKDGVAAYVFAGDSSAEEEAAAVGALTRPEHRRFRRRRLTASNRTLASSMTRILNRMDDGDLTLLH